MQARLAQRGGKAFMARKTGRRRPDWRPTPLRQALAVLLIAGGWSGTAQAQARAFSPGWFADKNAVQSTAQRTGRMPDGSLAGIGNSARQQAQSRQQLQRSLDNLNRTAAAVAAQQAAQAAARAAAAANGTDVPDGLAPGGLWVAEGALAKWEGAKAPKPGAEGGRQLVTIEQTQSRAILNWDSFNIGRNTTLRFKQGADDAVLNRVVGAAARPSQIQGAIQADGTVLVVNQNGVIFSGTSQVNARNLVVAAATITDAQFRDKGLYADNGAQPTFLGALGRVEVQAGARIATAASTTSTSGGGYVLLLGKEAANAGTIDTPGGQALLAAGDSFVIKRGQGTAGNLLSTTKGNEVTPAGVPGRVENSGLIQAAMGDVTLTGGDVTQRGVLLSSTSVDTRGTLHLTAAGADGRITLAEGSVAAILLDHSGAVALDSQRDGLRAPPAATTSSPWLSAGADRRELSRVEVSSSGTVDFASGSITLATGGQIAVQAARRSLLRDGAILDVAGAVGVPVAMENNNLKINVQGNEQRDAPVNRDSGKLNSNDLWVDIRDLVLVPAGTNGYATDRWYTAGGLLEVSGYLGTQGHAVNEWMAQGGNVEFTGGDVVTRAGSQINLSGGTLDVQDGMIRQSWLRGVDGKLYEASRAPGDLAYTGLYQGYEARSERWGQTRRFYNPLIAPLERFETGYTVGRDAGRLLIGTRAAVLEGELIGTTFQGDRQNAAPQAGLDGYQQSQRAAARGAQLVVGTYTPYYNKTTGAVQYALGRSEDTVRQVVLSERVAAIAAGLELGDALPADRGGALLLDTARLNGFGLGAVRIAAQDIAAQSDLAVAPGGEITLYANRVTVDGALSARGGSIRLGNVLNQVTSSGMLDTSIGATASDRLTLGAGGRLDTSGLWTNLALAPGLTGAMPYLNGGSVSLRGSGDILLERGGVIDVGSGAALRAKGKLTGGKGGNVTIETVMSGAEMGRLDLGAELRGYGVDGGGTLAVTAGKVALGATPAQAGADVLALAAPFFQRGFARYEIIGSRGVTVADGARIEVSMPVYRPVAQAGGVPTGAEAATALQAWLPPVYLHDAVAGTATRRRGASLSLQSGRTLGPVGADSDTTLLIGQGAQVAVDPGQTITLRGAGQITVLGGLTAAGGKIDIRQLRLGDIDVAESVETADGQLHNRSIWIGERAVLDVAGRAQSGIDAQGRRYGVADAGGVIVIGGEIDHARATATSSDAYVIVRPGAVLDASGAGVDVDINGVGPLRLERDGGRISLSSYNGLHLDGAFIARAGGASAMGGTLDVALETPLYRIWGEGVAGMPVQVPRELVLAPGAGGLLDAALTPGAAADGLRYGQTRLDAARLTAAGGFDHLGLLANGLMSFDGAVDVAVAGSMRLYASAYSLAPDAAARTRVNLAAPYVRLSGPGTYFATNGMLRPRVLFGDAPDVGAGVFTVRAGSLLEVGNSLSFGTQGSINRSVGGLLTVARSGFDRVALNSGGDLRFLRHNDDQPRTRLWTRGDLDLTAAQLYPVTGAEAELLAGYTRNPQSGVNVFDPTRTLRVGRAGDAGAALPAVPYSAFGTLRLAAASVEQGGVLRAPLGTIVLGDLSSAVGTQRLTLLPGSVTSVSGAGLWMPYGGTTDGVSYKFQGAEVALPGAGGAVGQGQGASLRTGITLGFRDVDALPGSLLDLSGGGELTGAGFVSGRGGSTDARYFPLVRNDPKGGFTLPGLATNPVYAIVPGAQPGYAPAGGEAGASTPGVGRQITLGDGVPGLPAGTYTLMPSTYALLPGAFRVEINGQAAAGAAIAPLRMRNLSWAASGVLSTAGAGAADRLASQVILTPANVLRTYSQYNEMSYASFVRADAATRGVPRAMLPADARTLRLAIHAGSQDGQALRFEGLANFNGAPGGFGGTAALNGGSSSIEILAAGQAPTAGFGGASVHADALAALGASRLVIGALPVVLYGQGGRFYTFQGGANEVVMRSGAQLAAPEVLISSRVIEIEAGAGISTLGRGAPSVDSTGGFAFQPGSAGLLALSNGRLDVLAPDSTVTGAIRIGTCATGACEAVTRLYSEGTIAVATNGVFDLGEQARYGTRNLALAVGTVNVGTTEALRQAAARGVLPSGLTLNQAILARLLRGDASAGAPALEMLTLTAREAVNFYGTVALDTRDPVTGDYRMATLALGTPALYGYGEAGDVASIYARNLVWNGAVQAPGAVAAGGAGTGRGALRIEAERIEFGYGQGAQPNGLDDNARLALGFAGVTLNASDRITANHRGSLAVYQSQGAYTSGSGYAYSGGNLTLNTPLLTGAAGSVNRITAGGDVRVLAASGAPAAQDTAQALGAELSLAGANVRVDGVIALPSGKLTLQGRDSVLLADGSKLDLAGRAIAFNDVLRYSWGGDLVLESSQGGIRQEAGSLIDLSARDNDAGNLRAVALAAADGQVALLGRILGSSSGRYDAGGTEVPYRAGSVEVRAQRLGAPGNLNADFEALNHRLNEGGVTGARSFQVKQGSLTLGDALRANDINLSIDGGSLTVVGRVDASGERVGRIRLAARDGLTLASSAVLDAHGTVLRVDSYGRIIDAPNRAVVELSSGQGVLTLAGGARIDLRHGTGATQGAAAGQHDGAARGTLDLMAPRIDAAGNAGLNGDGALGSAATYGDIAIDARGPLTIDGAKAINLTAMQRYDDALPGDPADRAGGREYQIIDQAYLEAKHGDSREFIRLALLNGNLLNGKLAGLNNATYRDVFHLRPGVEIISRTADGDLVVQGDLDLSRYRYASLNPRSPMTSAYGSGEAGALILRAKGNLDVYGSINDGFAPPPASPDDESGWVLTPGAQPFGGDVVLPRGGVQLADGTEFPGGKTLNYPLPLQATTLAAGTRLPVEAVLDQPLSLAVGTVLSGDVRDAGGQLLYAAGTVLKHALDLPAQTRLGPGTLLTRGTALKAFTWPANVALPNRYTTQAYEPNVLLMTGTITLQQGALIPSQTKLVFPEGTDYVELRPGTAADQRRNWALARMLPAGSQSWSVQLTAGADLDAADRRQVLPGPGAGKLTLADTHYNATLVKGAGLVWGPDGASSGFEPGKPVPDDMLWLCDVVEGLCLPPPRWVWAKDNWWGQPEGSPVADADLATCEAFPDQCVENKQTTTVATHTQNFSVLRTGTGDLDLAAGGDINLMSAYGVYTAGTQSANVAPAYQLPRGRYGSTVLGDAYASNYEPFVVAGAGYQAWYPEAGGNFSLYAGGALRGDVWGKTVAGNYDGRVIDPSVGIGNWLWRQGSGSANGGDTPTAWWINFGSYAPARPEFKDSTPVLVGFTGFGALGGGNVSVRADGDAGNIESRGSIAYPRGQGLVVAVGGTGRVAADGSVVLTGGGDIDMRIGGALNPTQSARGRVSSTAGTTPYYGDPAIDLQGALINLRGNVRLTGGAVGGLDLQYGNNASLQDAKDSRGYDPYTATLASATGGLALIPGDAVIRLDTRGDLVVGGASDPGRVAVPNSTPFRLRDGTPVTGGGTTWFSLWTDNTAITLSSAGGNLTPSRQTSHSAKGMALQTGLNTSASDARYLYPSILRATAYDGSIYAGVSAGYLNTEDTGRPYSLTLAPGARGQLELLAGDSIYAGGYAINRSGADPASVAGVRTPAFAGYASQASQAPVLSNRGSIGGLLERDLHFPLFYFGTPTASAAGSGAVTRLYARDGDIVGLRSGETLTVLKGDSQGQTWFEAAGPVWMMAGRDIVASGTGPGAQLDVPSSNGYNLGSGGGAWVGSSGNLFLHRDAREVSRVSAGRDILYSSFQVAGPGALEVSAGRQVLMADQASITSLGAVMPGDRRPGASIAVLAGVGAAGPDYAGFLARYLDTRAADPGRPLTDQGVAFKTYQAELLLWLTQHHDFAGSVDDAHAYFNALPAEQRNLFARQVYFAELRAGGREYNDKSSARYGSYLRGRQAIAALFPDTAPGAYQGDITLYGGAGIRSTFGGDIQLLTPGGQQVFGLEGAAPPATAGIITQGEGSIQLYALGSILLGQSRVMTTFGGGITAWSAQGDINAGRGAKTTVLYAPPKRVYDTVGNVTLSPNAPGTGAGIATLAPLPEVPAGDVDLYAPLGTIDAGEAGIRVSGNVNIAALQVVNAANIQAQGESKGVPVTASVNTGAMSSASAAAASAVGAAQESAQRAQSQARQNRPSVISVQILGYGEEPVAGASMAPPPGPAAAANRYDAASAVQVLGAGALDDSEMRQLSAQERGKLAM
ncbi:filamentous hemagglutinin family protein [Achromobacter ruhlandii]|uniref:filamentous haemagglutinin family protein n=3 Tax=Achromobacter ruhlandii TaxID=72557 RepID=UPI0021F1FE36|nr:filamentous haemagglutinin family protein [Achromobacter ruhlandii]MCV6809387.1 filamentous hemagglutinin family protein [Achromobacter ruhlandii]MCV6818815.1 filamentous hemagglutinin family protein [Achromobacter ruhlandii]